MAGVPPLKGAQYSFDICLVSQVAKDIFKTSPTLAAADITVALDGAGANNITNLPASPADGVIHVTLTAAEMNADRVAVLFHDVAGNEWQDALVTIDTDTAQASSVVLAATQPAITWAQQKIVADVANEGALDIVNSAAQGIGQRNVGGEMLNGCGQRNIGAVGQINDGSAIGQENNAHLHGAAAAYGQYNAGPVAQYNEGTGLAGIGIKLDGAQAGLYGENSEGPVIDLQGYKAGQPVVRIEGNAVGTNAIDLVTSNGIGLRIAAGGATRDGISVLGGKSGIRAEGTAEYGIQAVGGTADLDPMPAAPGDAMNTTQWGGVAVGGMPNSTTPPTVGQVADAVYDEMLAGHVLAGSGAEAWADAAACGLGADGPIRTYTVTNSLTGLPEAGVYVRVTTDVAGLNTIRAGYTDVFGNFYPRLIAGTYYFWCTKQGFGEVQADQEVFV